MKKLISLIFAISIIAAIACNNEQTTEYRQNIDIQKITANVSTNLYDVDFIDSNYGFIVGDSGTVIKTTDGGETWGIINVELTNRLSTVKLLTENTFFIGGKDIILNSSNKGLTWEKLEIQGDINSIRFNPNNENTGFAVGGFYAFNDFFSAIYTTSNNGQKWNLQNETKYRELGFLSSVIFLDSDILLSSSLCINFSIDCDKNIYKSTDIGNEFKTVYKSEDKGTYSMYGVDESSILAVGSKGTIPYSSDKGESWVTKTSGVADDLYSISGISKDVYYAVGDNGTVISTANKGQNWSKKSSGVDVALNSICFPSAKYGIAVGDNGTILKITFE